MALDIGALIRDSARNENAHAASVRATIGSAIIDDIAEQRRKDPGIARRRFLGLPWLALRDDGAAHTHRLECRVCGAVEVIASAEEPIDLWEALGDFAIAHVECEPTAAVRTCLDAAVSLDAVAN